MSSLDALKTKAFITGNQDLGEVLNLILKVFQKYPSLESIYLPTIEALDNNGTLNIATIKPIKDAIDNDEKALSIPKKKKIIFKILNKYLAYIRNILSNQNESKQFNSVIHSFATELSVKLLYALTRIDDIVTEVPDLDHYIDKNLSYEEEGRIVYGLDMFLMSLDGTIATDYNKLTTIFKCVKTKKLPDEFVKNSAGKRYGQHANVKYLNTLPKHMQSLINYYVIKYFSEKNLDPSQVDNEKFDYIDYFLMTRDFLRLEDEIKTDNALQEINSERFFWNRYDPVEETTETNYQFALAMAMASYLIYKDTTQHYYEDSTKEMAPVPSVLSFISKHYTKNIQSYLDRNIDKRELLIDLNKRYPNLMIEINNGLLLSEFEDFITKMNIDEINYLFNEIRANPNSNNICDLIRYCTNFKNKLNNYNSLTFNDAKYARINKLFKMLSDTQDLTYVGAQLRNWLDSIDLHELTPEELVELDKIDPNFVYSQLDYRSQVIYKKCRELNIQYRYYYRRFTNAQLELLFKMFKFTGAHIPLQAVALTNVEIARAFENGVKGSLSLSGKMLSYSLENAIYMEVLKGFNKTRTIESLRDYIRTTVSKETIIFRNTGLNYVMSNQLKDDYYDADFETTKAIADFYNNNVEKMNQVPGYIVLCSYDRLSVLLKLYGGDLDILCSLPMQQFISYPNRELLVSPNHKAILLLGKRTSIERSVLESQYSSITRRKIINTYPEFLNHNFNYDGLYPAIYSNLEYIKSHVDEENFVKIVELLCDKREATQFTREEYSFSDGIQAVPEIFKYVFDKVSNGDMTSNIEAKASKMKSISGYLKKIISIESLTSIVKCLFDNKKIEELTDQDYKRISVFPDYLLRSTPENVGNNIQTFLLEQRLSKLQKKDGVKLLTPQEIELSYYKLQSYLARHDEEGNLILPNIDIEPLMYIDYNDVSHLIHVNEALIADGCPIDKNFVLAMIKYLSDNEYKIDVHTFGPHDATVMVFNYFANQNDSKPGPTKAA